MDVCRLCLDVIIGDSFKLLDEDFVNMIQTIIPELNLDISTEPLSCMSCYNTLQQLYEFKSTCLKIEEDVTASLKIEEDIKPRYRKDGFGDFCIESNSNSNEFMQRKKNRFCRTCQVPIECESFTVLKPSEPDYYLDNMLVMCLPEIDLDIVENPVMCEKCLESLQRLHHFKSSCSNAEERIKSYMAQCGSNSMNQIDLSSVLDGDIKFSSSEYQSVAGQFDGVIKTEADDCIKEEVLTVEESPDDLFSEDECMLTEEDIKNEIGEDQQQKIETTTSNMNGSDEGDLACCSKKLQILLTRYIPAHESTMGSDINNRKSLGRLAKSVARMKNTQISLEEQEEGVKSEPEYCPLDSLSFGDNSRHSSSLSDDIYVKEAFHNEEISLANTSAFDVQKKSRPMQLQGKKTSQEKISGNRNKMSSAKIRFCKGSNSLKKLAKSCFFNWTPNSRLNVQSGGQTVTSGYFRSTDVLVTNGILSSLRADRISLVAKKDPIICDVARYYLNNRKRKHLTLVAKNMMRSLARLLISVRELRSDKKLRLIDILKPSMFKTLIDSCRDIAGFDNKNGTFKSPTYALQIGGLIKNAIKSAYSKELQKVDPSPEVLAQLMNLKVLMKICWAREISSESGRNQQMEVKKPTMISLAEDIAKFNKYLNVAMHLARQQLIDIPSNLDAFTNLQEAIFCSFLLLNKHEVEELQRINLPSFMLNYQCKIEIMEFEQVLTQSEKILHKSLRRVVISGEKTRRVPVLFTKEMIEGLNHLISLRNKFNLDGNIYLFAMPGTDNSFLVGDTVMRKYVKLAFQDSSKATMLISAEIREPMATIAQILKMNRSELKQLAMFMGHTEQTHRQFYRLPNNLHQTAKLSKILLMSKNGCLDKYKGKSLYEIKMSEKIVEDLDQYDSDEQLNEHKSQARISNCKVKATTFNFSSKRKFQRIPWTIKEKVIADKYFRHHIENSIIPKNIEVLEFIKRYPTVFKNRTWPAIKTYVQNKYTGKLK